MRITVIADDKSISIDGETYDKISMPELPSNIHAIQWYDTFGEIEFKTEVQGNKFIKPENQIITDLNSYSWIAEKHAIAKQSYEESLANGNRYVWNEETQSWDLNTEQLNEPTT